MASPTDKHLIIGSLQILLEMRVDEIFKGESRFFSKKSTTYFFLDYITNKTETDWNKTETVAQIKVSMVIIFKNNKIKPIHSLVGSTAFHFIFWLNSITPV